MVWVRWKGKSEGEGSDEREGHEIRMNGRKEGETRHGVQGWRCDCQCGGEEKEEDDGRAEGTALCRELRGSQGAQRTAQRSVWVCSAQQRAVAGSSNQHQQRQLCGARSFLTRLRFAGSGRAGA